jgi:hypothetical protein
MMPPPVAGYPGKDRVGGRVCREKGDTVPMKSKSAGRTFITKSVRASRLKAVPRAHDPGDPSPQPRPFLVHALRLRSRKPTR